jgi:hypothetical protein
MITFKNILEEKKDVESRGQDLVAPLIYKYTGNKSIENRTKIYRRKKTGTGSKIFFIEPSKFERKSINTANYYTLLIDNSKYWIDYPKRSQSIIGCSTYDIDDTYGKELYQIIPKLNAKIGICPKEDIWYSFSKGLKIINYVFDANISLSYFGEPMHRFNNFLSLYFKIKKNDGFKIIKNKINNYKFDPEDKLAIKHFKKYGFKTVYELIDYCLSPELNGFKLAKYSNNFHIPKGKEIWTDADSLMISAEEENYL